MRQRYSRRSIKVIKEYRMANKEKYMVVVGFKGTEFNPLSFYAEGEPVKHGNDEIIFVDPMQKSNVTIASGTYSFFSTKKITNKEFKEHKVKVAEQEKICTVIHLLHRMGAKNVLDKALDNGSF
jgi:hypothetical protein